MIASTDPERLLDLASRLAWEAAEVILALRARGCATETKPDDSPVTEADRQAEILIARGLREATPDIGLVAEEEISAGYAPPEADAYWMVDPLDGTRDFVALRDSFTVNIGLVRHGRPVLGVVCVPASAELFSGIVGVGAWKQDLAGRRRIAARTPLKEGLVVLTSRQHGDAERLQPYLGGHAAASITHLGSSLKLCRVAEGTADFYARFGRTMEWDTAGPEAVLEAAGGSLRLMDGSVLVYGKPDWANPPFICRGRA